MDEIIRFSRISVLIVYVFSLLLLFAQPAQASNGEKQSSSQQLTIHTGELEVFVREGCPHCTKAKAFLSALNQERPQLRIVYFSVDRDPDALEKLTRYSQAAGIWSSRGACFPV